MLCCVGRIQFNGPTRNESKRVGPDIERVQALETQITKPGPPGFSIWLGFYFSSELK